MLSTYMISIWRGVNPMKGFSHSPHIPDSPIFGIRSFQIPFR